MVILCDFQVSFLFGVLQDCGIDKIPEAAKTKVSKPKRYSLSVKTRPHPPKTPHSKHASRLRHDVEIFA